MVNDDRIDWIDCLRGIGILFVVLGHTTSIPFLLQQYIYSFHLPLFFFISGSLFNFDKYRKLKILDFIKLRFNRLIIPYFFMAGVCLLTVSLLDLKNHRFDYQQFLHNIHGIIFSFGTVYWMPSCSPLWFLTGLFVIETLFYTTLKQFNVSDSQKVGGFYLRSKNIAVCIALFAAVGSFLSYYEFPKLFWNMDTALTGIVFYWAGYLSRILIFNKKLINSTLLIVVFVLGSMISMYFNKGQLVSFNQNRYGNILAMYLGAFSGIGTAFILSHWSSRLGIKCVKDFLAFWGKNTLPVIGFDYLTLNLLNIFFIKFHMQNLYILNFFIHLIILYILIFFLIQIPILQPFIFGRRK